MTNTTISLAPLQGFTEYPYRNALHEIIGGVDKYFTPYLRLQNDGTLKKKNLKDILPENNKTKVIPQVLVKNSTDFIYLANLLEDHGYSEVNINLGCPYPMVINRDLGAGLLKQPTRIIQMLEEALPKTKLKVSLKMRSGLYNAKEILGILPQLNQFPLTEIIIHPRIAKQLYRGYANKDVFIECMNHTKHKLAYNGDITTLEQYEHTKGQLYNIAHVMIGRGLLQNIFLAQEIKNQKHYSFPEKAKKLNLFHDYLFAYATQSTSGDSHLLNYMQQFWSYFSYNFPEQKKVFKAIKKCKKNKTYTEIINALF